MRRCFIYVIEAIVLWTLSGSPSAVPANAQDNPEVPADQACQPSERGYTVWEYIGCAGRDVDVHFTVELRMRRDTNEPPCPFEGWIKEPLPPPLQTVGELAAHLRKTLKGITIIQNERHPNVLHLIEGSLVKRKDYALDQKIDIRHAGWLGALPAAVGKIVPGVRVMGFDPYRRVHGDSVTRIDVGFQDRTVREILTDAVPIKEYAAPLWSAYTYTHEDGTTDYINVGYSGRTQTWMVATLTDSAERLRRSGRIDVDSTEWYIVRDLVNDRYEAAVPLFARLVGVRRVDPSSVLPASWKDACDWETFPFAVGLSKLYSAGWGINDPAVQALLTRIRTEDPSATAFQVSSVTLEATLGQERAAEFLRTHAAQHPELARGGRLDAAVKLVETGHRHWKAPPADDAKPR